MTRPLHKGIARILARHTIAISKNTVIVSAKNSAFPSLAENMAIRAMLQDISDSADHYCPTVSKDAMQ